MISNQKLHAFSNSTPSASSGRPRLTNAKRLLGVFSLIALSACSTAGTGNLNAEITKDKVSASLKLGANMSGPWRGKVVLKKSMTESTVEISGQGSNVNRTPGHKATAAVVKDSLNAAISGAKMGFAP